MQNPLRGYGVFIEKMLANEKLAKAQGENVHLYHFIIDEGVYE